MDYLVLGQIPGTTIYLSFQALVIVAGSAALLLFALIKTLPKRNWKSRKKNLQKIIDTAL